MDNVIYIKENMEFYEEYTYHKELDEIIDICNSVIEQ